MATHSSVFAWRTPWTVFKGPKIDTRRQVPRSGDVQYATGEKWRAVTMGWVGGSADSVDINLSKLWETVKDKGACHAAVHGTTKSLT